ncbi:hypothetical protein RCL_jg25583.t1 [Rhizophagus clarus]|uniref:Uncharacterized protein n=1 Tax=Rhizophagus clarus TaxID=94130 RepID=A0A8H3LLX1_9GLOM|nr:hypothetical protein RCL_jg25583.t1 [Rhizophagus clarus]
MLFNMIDVTSVRSLPLFETSLTAFSNLFGAAAFSRTERQFWTPETLDSGHIRFQFLRSKGRECQLFSKGRILTIFFFYFKRAYQLHGIWNAERLSSLEIKEE